MANPKEHKYKILAQAAQRGHTIRFSILYSTTTSPQHTLKEELGEREGYFIRALRPPLNYQIPKADNWKSYDINPIAQTISLTDLLERGNRI